MTNILETRTSGILLPNSTSSANLDYYEMNVAHNTTWSGPWATAQTGNCTISRISNIVIFRVPLVTATSTASQPAVMDTAMPARFRPPADCYYLLSVNNNVSATGNTNAVCLIAASGVITVYKDALLASFNIGVIAAIEPSCLVWIL